LPESKTFRITRHDSPIVRQCRRDAGEGRWAYEDSSLLISAMLRSRSFADLPLSRRRSLLSRSISATFAS